MPLIALSSCRKIEDYRQAILHAGGEVRVVDASIGVEKALDGVDGLVLSGGGDVDPSRYGEPPHPAISEVEPERDAFEIGLITEARRRDLPIFGICRGVQILNVAAGGTLVQDIPTQLPGAINHCLSVPQHLPYELAHEIWVEKDSLLARLMGDRLVGSDTTEVNSRHHQAVKTVAPGFRVSATAPDGVIEAIEDPAARFCIGVEWHPENFWRTGEFRALYEGFLEEAARKI